MRPAGGYPQLGCLTRNPMKRPLNLKIVAKGLAALNIPALVFTAALAWFPDRSSGTERLDLATYAGLGMGALAPRS
jgi:hypothetical protein